MSARHTFAASLAGLLIVEAATLAQEPSRFATKEAEAQVQAVVAIPRPEAIRLLLTRIAPGSNVRVELADGSRVEGTIVELSADAVIVADGKFRKVVMASDIVGVRLRVVAGMATAKAFGIGAAVGGAIILGMLSRMD
jgi:hypothetical protein